MKSISGLLMAVIILLSTQNTFAHIKNIKGHTTEYSQIQSNGETINTSELQKIFDEYFALKDALAQSNAKSVSEKAAALSRQINAVDMNKLSTKEHNIWMGAKRELLKASEEIAGSKSIEKQRKSFAFLSKKMYELMKVSKYADTVYYQHCPMKKENWLSKEKQIKNPYYGSKMMSCGSTVDTLNN